jgi:probable HAF family extracellular repeat protein
MTDLGTLGGNYASASAINDRGQVVGASTTTSGEGHAFLWQDGTMTDLGTLGGGGSGADAINDEGQIVGMAADPPGGPDIIFDQGRGFVWQDGVMRDLGIDFDGQHGAGLAAMNERGQVIVTTGALDAVLWQNGTQTTVGAHSEAHGLNDRGEVVGWHSRVDDVPSDGFVPGNAFLWRDGTMTDLGSLKGTQSRAMGINECGQIVGMSGKRGVTWYTR